MADQGESIVSFYESSLSSFYDRLIYSSAIFTNNFSGMSRKTNGMEATLQQQSVRKSFSVKKVVAGCLLTETFTSIFLLR